MRAITRGDRFARLLRRDEVIALVGKIQRRLELRDDVEQLLLDRADRRRQRAFELIERRPRLQRRDGVDQIGDRLRLDEIELLIEERAKRELAWLREPRAGVDRGAKDRAQDNGTAVRRNFNHVLARCTSAAPRNSVKTTMIESSLAPGTNCNRRERRVSGLRDWSRPMSSHRNARRVRAAEANHTETAAPGGVAMATMVSEVENTSSQYPVARG